MVHRFYTTPETARELTALKKKNGFYFRTLTRTDNIDRVYCEVTDPGYQFIKENGITIEELNYVIRDREAGNEIERFATREEAEQQLAQYEEQDRADGIFVEDFYEIVERCNDNEKMKRISWDEYYKTKQDVYLDNENVADMSVKFDLCNENGERVRASVLKAYSDESFFGGGNDEYIVIDFNGNSFLLYDCTLEEVESSYRELGFK